MEEEDMIKFNIHEWFMKEVREKECKDEISFKPRGIGSDGHLQCFCCHTTDKEHRAYNPFVGGYGLMSNISGLVNSKQEGEKIVHIFENAKSFALLDYRIKEPNWIQVKIGACNKHYNALKRLFNLLCIKEFVLESDIRKIVWAADGGSV